MKKLLFSVLNHAFRPKKINREAQDSVEEGIGEITSFMKLRTGIKSIGSWVFILALVALMAYIGLPQEVIVEILKSLI